MQVNFLPTVWEKPPKSGQKTIGLAILIYERVANPSFNQDKHRDVYSELDGYYMQHSPVVNMVDFVQREVFNPILKF